MVLLVRVEVRTSRCESWPLAFGNLMNVSGVFAWWQILQIQFDRHTGAAPRLVDGSPANIVTFCIPQLHRYGGRLVCHGYSNDYPNAQSVFDLVFFLLSHTLRTAQQQLKSPP